MLAVGLLASFHDYLFSVTDAILLALLPVTWSRARHIRPLRTLVQLCALWSLCQVISNAVNGIPTSGLLGGVWQPILMTTSSLGLFWFTDGTPRHTAAMAATTFAVSIAFGLIVSSPTAVVDPWKYAFGVPVTLLAVLAIGFLWAARHTIATAVLMASLGCLNLALGFRSFGAICIVSSSLLLAMSMFNRASVWRISLAVLAGIMVSMAIAYVYGSLAKSGRLGYAQQAKYAVQSSVRAGLLLTARPEALLSLNTIRDRPILGLGYEARTDYATTEELIEALAAQGIELVPVHQERLLGNGLNSHSLVLGAWVRAGVLAVLPWLYLVHLGLRSSFLAPCQRWEWSRPIMVLWTVLLVWDFLFSPWSPHYQLLLGSFVALAVGRLTDRSEGKRGSQSEVLEAESSDIPSYGQDRLFPTATPYSEARGQGRVWLEQECSPAVRSGWS